MFDFLHKKAQDATPPALPEGTVRRRYSIEGQVQGVGFRYRARYAAQGLTDKIALLDTRPRLYSDLYTLGDTDGYFYGALAPSTGFVDLFGIEPYYNGFYLALPLRTAPDRLNTNVEQEKMFGIFQEYQSWVRIMGVPTVGAVNSKVLAGDAGGMIKLAEAFHERKFAWVADTIYDANISRGVRMVLISGPSSSGKTTSAKRLGIQLGVLGLQPVLISLDDYFVDRTRTPKDENGESAYFLEVEAGDKFSLEWVEMSQEQFEALPQFEHVRLAEKWLEEITAAGDAESAGKMDEAGAHRTQAQRLAEQVAELGFDVRDLIEADELPASFL